MTGSGQLWRAVAWTAVPPLVVLVVMLALLAWTGGFGEQWRFTLQWAPVAIAAGGLGVALHFNRSRAFFATLTLLVAWFALLHAGDAGGFAERAVFAAASVFVPLNLMVFSTIRERGVFTRAGTFRFLLLFLQVVFVAIVVWSESAKLLWLLTAPIFESGLTRALAVAPPGLLMMLIALLMLHARLVLEPVPERAAFFGAAVASALALYGGHEVPWTGSLLASGGVMFLVALLQTSWRMAFLDELTGLPGRRALEEQLMRLGDDYVIAMVDVDHFKKFNDTWGHDAGDEVLRMVASRLAEVGSGGRAFRYGGEEFTIVFPNHQMRDTLAALGNLRNTIAGETFVIRRRDRRVTDPKTGVRDDDSREVNITISVGVAESGVGGATPHEVMRSADKALYRAKQGGRNQVCR